MMLTLCGPLAESGSWASRAGSRPAQVWGWGPVVLAGYLWPTPGPTTGRPAWARGNQARGLALKIVLTVFNKTVDRRNREV